MKIITGVVIVLAIGVYLYFCIEIYRSCRRDKMNVIKSLLAAIFLTPIALLGNS